MKIRRVGGRPAVTDPARLEHAAFDAARFLEAMAAESLTSRGERDYGRVMFMLFSMVRTVHELSDAEAREAIEKQVRQLLVQLYEAPS